MIAKCREKGTPICVGLDPVWERLPASIRKGVDAGAAGPVVEAIRRYCSGVLRAVAPHVPCVKVQSACFERYLWPGVEAYHHVISEAASLGLVVIGDAKRGDIGVSAEHYAAGCLDDPSFTDLHGSGKISGPDALTINAYLGDDSLKPFIDLAQKRGKGLFALVRTSNPGGDAIQGSLLAGSGTVAEAIGCIVAKAGALYVGKTGYSLIGAVVGATKAHDAARLRELMPQQIFLVPGFGAQGGKASDVKACFKADGTGAIITASRSILYAYEKPATEDWVGAVEKATVEMKREIAELGL